MLINLKKYVLSIIYNKNNFVIDYDADFWDDLSELDFEEECDNV